ncbi:hypothetical protein C4585_00030 [Candidatus Parcubacteria bacterium]|nr:MAG: hypothetical protein C4585_00030 [Candidatus Parcubacteria bacterium]
MKREELKKFNLPDTPGVYFFKKGRTLLYVGKAGSLRDRVRSYFSKDLTEARSAAIQGMVADADSIEWEETSSVLEALILEANLIKKYEPPFNIDQKDNKSWNYVVITKEEFPRVLLVRGRELFSNSLEARSLKLAATFGPYPHGGQLKEALKMVRKIFPYRDTCTPCEQNVRVTNSNIDKMSDFANQACKPCFNRQIGLCPGVCTGEVSKEEYAKNIRNLRELFSGKFRGLKQRLAREMKAAAKSEDFERADALRRQVSALGHIRDVSLISDERRIMAGGGVRIESFDVAHTAGSETVAVMTVVQNGEAVKAAYRKFKIRSVGNNDVAALKEALSRRLNHTEWPLPRIFVVDGAKAQVRAAEKVLDDAGVKIPVIGVVKNEFHKPKGLIGDARLISAHEKDILLANNEAHRFGIGWHRTRLRKGMV